MTFSKNLQQLAILYLDYLKHPTSQGRQQSGHAIRHATKTIRLPLSLAQPLHLAQNLTGVGNGLHSHNRIRDIPGSSGSLGEDKVEGGETNEVPNEEPGAILKILSQQSHCPVKPPHQHLLAFMMMAPTGRILSLNIISFSFASLPNLLNTQSQSHHTTLCMHSSDEPLLSTKERKTRGQQGGSRNVPG